MAKRPKTKQAYESLVDKEMDQELRKWCVEQALRFASDHEALRAAQKLYDWVKRTG